MYPFLVNENHMIEKRAKFSQEVDFGLLYLLY